MHPTNSEKHDGLAPVFQLNNQTERHSALAPIERQRSSYEQASGLLLVDLISPEYETCHGEALAVMIDEALSPPKYDDETTLLQTALLELTRAEEARIQSADDDYDSENNYEAKCESDTVCSTIVNYLKGNVSSDRRRRATRKLLELRLLSPDDVTPHDEAWFDIFNRIVT